MHADRHNKIAKVKMQNAELKKSVLISKLSVYIRVATPPRIRHTVWRMADRGEIRGIKGLIK